MLATTSANARAVPRARTWQGVIFFDSLTHDPTALAFLGQRVGWEHVLLGTDYPWDMADEHPIRSLIDAGLDGQRMRQVAVDNIRSWLRPAKAGVSSGSGS